MRYPLHDPLARTVKLLEHYGVSCVVDVGANDGGFASAIRALGYRGQIISFEPLNAPFRSLSRLAKADGAWEVMQCAVGDSKSQMTMHVSGNSGLSSSILPMLKAHTDVAPNSTYVGTETVGQERLDDLLPERNIGPESRMFLKVDVQGYERAVLDGASRLFADRTIIGLQMELSLVPLYEGAMTYREALDRAEGLGMTLMGLDPVFTDPRSGQLLQADAVFFHDESLVSRQRHEIGDEK
ncbi:FkbM family methyltransferase [Mycolicibacterium austroafricanum]|uniref:FkbM family methyltransferase n=1 Tax=Mycolicibacterium austroafricanum TaxID=39687 RepID=A0ABT8HJ83_MYCAO|nr:FkbM family methyltransferase [Mycolicibacterium austroafricanum]MDN4520337.1 FkbM family methyltransferase [Mycolicibacterium austroafricanum]